MKKIINVFVFGLLFLGSCDVLLADDHEIVDNKQISSLPNTIEENLNNKQENQIPKEKVASESIDYCQVLGEKLTRNRFEQLVWHPSSKDFDKCKNQLSEDTLSNRRMHLQGLSEKIANEKALIDKLSDTINNIRVLLSKIKADQAKTNLTEEEQLALYEQETQLKNDEISALRDIHSHSIAFQKLWQEKDEYILTLNKDRQNLNLHEEERIKRSEIEQNEVVSLVKGLLALRNAQ